MGTAAQWVCDATRDLVSGVYTAKDEQLYQALRLLFEELAIEVEPSAAISCIGPKMLDTAAGKRYIQAHQLEPHMHQCNHIAWLTGGSFVPADEHVKYRQK